MNSTGHAENGGNVYNSRGGMRVAIPNKQGASNRARRGRSKGLTNSQTARHLSNEATETIKQRRFFVNQQQEIKARIATLESERQEVIRECKERNRWCKENGIKDPSRDAEVARLSMLSHSIQSDILFLKNRLEN